MGRYDNTSITLNRKNQRVLVPTLYPEIPLSDSDQFVYPKDGERLENIAFQYYGDVSLWWIIAQANGIKGFTSLYPNNFKGQLRIPTQIQDILSEYNSFMWFVVLFALITLVYCSPILEGERIKQGDIIQFQGMSKEIQDFREETGNEALWTNSMFGGMPAYQISVKYPNNILLHIDKALQLVSIILMASFTEIMDINLYYTNLCSFLFNSLKDKVLK